MDNKDYVVYGLSGLSVILVLSIGISLRFKFLASAFILGGAFFFTEDIELKNSSKTGSSQENVFRKTQEFLKKTPGIKKIDPNQNFHIDQRYLHLKDDGRHMLKGIIGRVRSNTGHKTSTRIIFDVTDGWSVVTFNKDLPNRYTDPFFDFGKHYRFEKGTNKKVKRENLENKGGQVVNIGGVTESDKDSGEN